MQIRTGGKGARWEMGEQGLWPRRALAAAAAAAGAWREAVQAPALTPATHLCHPPLELGEAALASASAPGPPRPPGARQHTVGAL